MENLYLGWQGIQPSDRKRRYGNKDDVVDRSRCIDRSDVQIGDGAVIAAGSVVTKNVSNYEIVGSNPARHIRYRFTDQQISELKRIK